MHTHPHTHVTTHIATHMTTYTPVRIVESVSFDLDTVAIKHRFVVVIVQIFALLRKRIKHMSKQKGMLLVMVFLPSFVISMSILVQEYRAHNNYSHIPMTLDRYANKFTVMVGGDLARANVSLFFPSLHPIPPSSTPFYPLLLLALMLVNIVPLIPPSSILFHIIVLLALMLVNVAPPPSFHTLLPI